MNLNRTNSNRQDITTSSTAVGVTSVAHYRHRPPYAAAADHHPLFTITRLQSSQKQTTLSHPLSKKNKLEEGFLSEPPVEPKKLYNRRSGSPSLKSSSPLPS
ncbi:hypothetical protein Hanom_Chr13g01204021 [Helianthus anomalus]